MPFFPQPAKHAQARKPAETEDVRRKAEFSSRQKQATCAAAAKQAAIKSKSARTSAHERVDRLERARRGSSEALGLFASPGRLVSPISVRRSPTAAHGTRSSRNRWRSLFCSHHAIHCTVLQLLAARRLCLRTLQELDFCDAMGKLLQDGECGFLRACHYVARCTRIAYEKHIHGCSYVCLIILLSTFHMRK